MNISVFASVQESYNTQFLEKSYEKFCKLGGALIMGVSEGGNECFFADKGVEESEVDAICHVKGESVFTGEFTLEDIGEAIVMPYTPYDALTESDFILADMKDQILKTREACEDVLGIDLPYEFARRLPLTYPIGAYRELREFLHEKDFEWKEEALPFFNIMGAFCWMTRREEFLWVNTEEEILKDLPFIQDASGENILIL